MSDLIKITNKKFSMKELAIYAFGAYVALVLFGVLRVPACLKSKRAPFRQTALRSPVGVLPTERFDVEPEMTTLGSQASKITVTGTNLSSQRRGILSPMAKAGINESGSNRNIWAGIRGSNPSAVKESFGAEGPIWNASDIKPETGVRNRYL